MKNKDIGASLRETGSSSLRSPEPPEGVSAHSGYDPARVRANLGYFSVDGYPGVPEVNPGAEGICPVCDKPMGPLGPETSKCRSFRVCDERSWFFYYHAACATEEGMKLVEQFNDKAVTEAFHHADARRNAVQ